MPARLKLGGRRFGRLTVLWQGEHVRNRPAWLCRCDCGGMKTVQAGDLNKGLVYSCGCARRERCAALGRSLKITLPELIEQRRQRRERNNFYGYIRRKFGLSKEAYAELLQNHNHRCAICSSSERLHIDHHHATGKIRGALCGPCNRMIGLAKDNPETLYKAIEYLGKFH